MGGDDCVAFATEPSRARSSRLFAVVAVWNAVHVPVDRRVRRGRAHRLRARARRATASFRTDGASYTPPGFYVARRRRDPGRRARSGSTSRERAAQLAECGARASARRACCSRSPGCSFRRGRWCAGRRWGSSSCCPVVLKTAAMFHPQPLVLFLSTLALVLTARMIVLRRYGIWRLGSRSASRSGRRSSCGRVAHLDGRRRRAHARGHGSRAARRAAQDPQCPRSLSPPARSLLALPWYVYLEVTTRNAVFGRGRRLSCRSRSGGRPRST